MQIAPLQPRLDWQMWFLALDPSFLSPWFNDFLKRIFQGNEGVIDLLGEYPFKERPPKFIKVSVGLYRYSTVLEKKKGKNYWVVQKLSSLVVES
jgi:hypothetical protein